MEIDTAALRIIYYPDPRLHRVCKPVEAFGAPLARLTERMLELMHQAEGIGLAGPQVGLLLRLFVCNVTGKPEDDQVFINPQITDFAGQAEAEEGCLSLPEVGVVMRRSLQCRILARDVAGKPIELAGSELIARCWQHEYDHLEGRLIVDNMSETDKIANRRALKRLEAQSRQRAQAG